MSVNGGAMVQEMVQEMPHTILSEGTSNYIRAAKLKAKLRQMFQREIKVHVSIFDFLRFLCPSC
jgi:hypothetical protein